MNWIEIILSGIGTLLLAIAGDYYRRLWALKDKVAALEEKMTSLTLAASLTGERLGYVKERVDLTHKTLEDKLLPSLSELNTQVALLSERLKAHTEGGK